MSNNLTDKVCSSALASLRRHTVGQRFIAFSLFLLGVVFFALPNDARAQQDVYWRNDTGASNWWDSGNPWWYVTWANSQNRPDNNSGTRNFVFFDNNNQTTTTVNGAFFALNTLTIQSGASSARTYNGSSGGGISLTGGLYVNTSANQTFNVEIGVDSSKVDFDGNAASTIAFQQNFYLNANTAEFGGSSSSSVFNITGTVSGTGGSITKTNGNLLTLSAGNSFTGGVRLGGGTLRIGNVSALGTGTLSVTAASTFASMSGTAYGINNAVVANSDFTIGDGTGTGNLTFSNTFNLGTNSRTLTVVNNSTISGQVSQGNLIKIGAGTLTLSGNNASTFTNATVGTGVLGVSGGSAISDSGAVILSNVSGATFLVSGSETIGSLQGGGGTGGNVSIASGQTLTVAESGSQTFSGIISNSGNFTKTGTGTLTLGGANTFGGTLTIAQGAISAGANNNLGGGSAMTISNAAKLITTGSFTSTRALTIGTGGGEINVATSTVFSNTGAVSGSTALTKTGSGTLALSNASSSYSGTIGVTAGTLQVNGTATSMDVNVTNSGSVLMGAGSIGDVTVNNGAFIAPGNSVGNLSVSSLTLEGGGGYNWEITAATGTAGTNWDLITVGGGSGTVTNNATSGNPFTIFMQGNPSGWDVTNSYSWTIINAGTITGFATNAFAVNFSGFTGATPTGTFSFSNVSGDLIMAYTAPDTTYNVTVGANTAANQGSAQATNSVAQFTGAAALNKLGAGTLIMTNPANNYSGVTTVKEGTLQINVNAPLSAAGALGTASSAVVVGDTAAAAAAGFNFGVAGITNARGLSVVAGTGSADRIIGTTITSGVAEQSGTVAVNTNTVFQAAGGGTLLVSGAISGAGNITISNSGLNIFSGVNTYSGTTTILTNSTLRIANNDALGTTAGATTVNGGGTLALSNNISSAEGITINGSGVSSAGAIRNISGNNTLSGGIVLGSASRINADTGTTLTLSGGVTGAGQALTLGGAGNITVSTTGINTTTSGSLTIDSTGVVTLGASGNYTGTTTLSSGTLRIGNNSALGTGGFSINGGVVASDGATARTVTNAITLGSNVQFGDATGTGGLTFSNINLGTSTRTLTVSNSTTVAGAITNTGGLTKAGSGTLILSGANTYTGATTLNAGVLQLSGGSAISDANALTLNGGTLVLAANETVGSITGAGNISLEGNQLIAGGNDSTTTYAGVMSSSGSGASFVKAGTGTTTLSGANTMNGQLYIDAGTLRFDLAQGASFTNTINVGMTTGSVAATLAIGTAGVTVANPITVRANSGVMTISALNTSGTATFSGATTLSNAVTLSANAGGNLSLGAVAMGNNSITYSGANNVTIGGAMTATTGAAELRVNGSGTLTLSGNNSSGNFMKIILNSGTLSVGSLNAFGQVGSFYFDKINFNGGTLAVTNDVTIDAGTFGMTSSGSGGTIDVAANKTFTQNANVLGNASGAFNKTGAGTLILGDAANGFNPTFNIQNGTVQVNDIGALGSNVTAIGLGSASTSGTLRYTGSSGSFSDNITVGAAGGTIDVTVASLGTTLTNSGIISGGALTKAGDSILVLSGNNTYSNTVISGGLLTVTADTNLGTAPAAAANNITIGNGRLGLNGNFTVGANRGITLTDANAAIDVYGGNTATVAGIITNTGAGALVKKGDGTLTLSGVNTYTGTTTVSNGAIRMTHASALGGSGAVSVGANTALQLTNNIAVGSKALTLNGTGIDGAGGALRSLGGSNSWAGNLTLSGNARINADAGTLTIGGTVNANSNEFYVGGSGNTTINGAISSTNTDRALFKDGAGTLTLSANNSGLVGGVQLREGVLSITNANSLGSGTLFLGTTNSSAAARLLVNETTSRSGSLSIQDASSGGVIEVASNKTFTSTGSLIGGTTNTSRFIKEGAGSLILAGASGNTYNGQILIGNGTVVLGTSTALGTNNLLNPRAIDLGLTVGDAPAAANVALILSNGVTNGNSIFVADNSVGGTNYTRTIGVSGASATLTNQIFLTGNLTFDVGGTSLLAVTNSINTSNIMSTGGLIKIGTGTLVLRGNNFSGGVTLSNGTIGIALGSSSATQMGSLGTGALTIQGGSLAASGAARTISNSITANADFGLGGLGETLTLGGTLNMGGAVRQIDTANNAVISGVISNGGLTKAGSANLTLSASNTYTGATTVNAGVLALTNAGRLASGTAVTVGAAGTLNFGGITNTVSSFTINGGSFTNGTLTAATYALQGGTVAGNLGAGTATASTGTTALNGTLDANLTVNGGTVNLGANDRVADAANVTISSGTLGMGTRTDTINIFTISGGTLGGTGTLTAANGYSLGGGTVSANLGTGSLTNTASTALNGTTAATTINVTGGTLTLGSASRFTGTTPAVSVSSGANLTLGGSETVGSLAGAGTVAIGANTLTVGSANTATTFSGILTGNNLTKVGNGTLTLSGGSSTYSGTTTLSNGTLLIGNNAALGSSSLRLDGGTLASDSADARTLATTAAIGGDVTFGQASGGTGSLTLGNIGVTGAARTLTTVQNLTVGTITNSVGLVKEGAATLTITGSTATTGSYTVNAGELRLANTSGNALNGALAINTGGTVFLQEGNRIGNTAEVTVAGGTLNMGGNSDNIGGLVLTNGGLVTNGTVTAANTGVALKDGTIAANVGSGILSIVKDSAGTVLLSGTNAYTNVTVINAGVLAVTNGNAIVDTAAVTLSNNAGTALDVRSSETIGSLRGGGASGGNVTISNAAVLTVAETGNETFAGAISGGGGLTKSGAGTTILSANHTYTGATTINGGTLSYGGTNTSTAVAINSGGTLAGTGSVGVTTVNSGGVIAPGNSPGTLAVSELVLEGGGSYAWEIGSVTGTPGTDWDLIVVGGGTGAVTVNANSGNQFIIDIIGNPTGWNSASNYSWNIIDWGTVTGFSASSFTVSTTNFTGATPTGSWLLSDSGGFLVLTYTNMSGTPTYSAGNGTWSTNFSPALTTGLDAIFDGAGGNATNDIASGTLGEIVSLVFDATAGSYTLSADAGSAGASGGTALLVAGNITNESTAAQTINLFLEFDAATTLDASAGDMTFGGAISNVGGIVATGAENTFFNGVISESGGFTKTGAGTATLSAANTFTGAVTVGEGELALTNGSALADTVAVTLSNIAGATLAVNSSETIGSLAGGGSTGGTVALGANDLTLAGNASTTYGGAITGTGTLVKQGTGTLTFNRASAYGTDFDLRLEGGVLDLNRNNDALSGILGANNIVEMAGGNLRLSSDAGSETDLSFGGLEIYNGTSALQINRTSGSTSHSTTLTGPIVFKEAGTLAINGVGTQTSTTVDFNSTTHSLEANATMNIGNNVTVDMNAIGQSGGSYSFTKIGAGVLNFDQANTYTGATIVGQGTLRMGLSGADISASSGLVVSNGAIFDLNNFNETIKGLTGAGSVSLGSATLTVSNTTADTFSGTITGTGGLAKSAAGTLTLTGANSYAGTTLISSGALQVGEGGSTGQLGAGNITNNASLVVNRTGEISLGNTVSGTGSLTKLAAGTLTLSASNSFQGGSTLSGGALRVAHANALGTGAMVSSLGTTLEVTNSINVTNTLSVYNVKFLNGGNTLSGRITNNNTVYDVNTGQTNTLSGYLTGTGSVTLIGGGVLAITGTTNDYTGNTVISNGTVRISTLTNTSTPGSLGVSNNITLAGTTTSTNVNSSTTAVIDYTGGNVTTDRTFVMDNGGGTINMATAATEMTLTGSASGSGKLIVGEGTLVLSNTATANAFSNNSIQVDSGATLKLAASNQIGNTTGLILNGGTLLVGASTLSDSLGTLTLSASSTIDFGAYGASGLRQITFANSSAITWTGTLTITNWQGVALTSSDFTEIVFGTGGLTSTQLGQIRFANQDINGGTLISGGELVPVPEPRVYAAAVALLGVVGWRERKRLLGLLSRGKPTV